LTDAANELKAERPQETLPKMATTQIETVSTGADKAKLAAAVVLAVGAIVAFYLLSKQGGVVQWIALLVGLAAAVGVFASSENGKQLLAFGRDSWREVKKVVWPTRKEAIQMTRLRVRLRGDHVDLPLAHRQDPRMGVF
jgi:preprotein translocase subunit SecE